MVEKISWHLEVTFVSLSARREHLKKEKKEKKKKTHQFI